MNISEGISQFFGFVFELYVKMIWNIPTHYNRKSFCGDVRLIKRKMTWSTVNQNADEELRIISEQHKILRTLQQTLFLFALGLVLLSSKLKWQTHFNVLHSSQICNNNVAWIVWLACASQIIIYLMGGKRRPMTFSGHLTFKFRCEDRIKQTVIISSQTSVKM